MRHRTTILAQTTLHDPQTGEPLYVHANIRPRWYWWWRTLRLFCGIVWRVYDVYPDGSNYRLSIATAWSVARGIHKDGLTRNDVCPRCDARLRTRSGLCVPCTKEWQQDMADCEQN